MIPSATNILRLRFIARVALRLGALYFLYWAAREAYDMAEEVYWYFERPDDRRFRDFSTKIHSVLEYAFLAALLLAADRWLLRWLVPASARRCPMCEHRTDRLAAQTCTECGAMLPREWVERPAGEAR